MRAHVNDLPETNPQSPDLNDTEALARLYAPPADWAREPIANFPLGWYETFLQEIRRLGIEVITYRDLFQDSDDWDHRSFYPTEFHHWHQHVREPGKTYLVIQHDVDNHPFFTQRMVAMELAHGVRSNIFIFHQRFNKAERSDAEYVIDHGFFQEAEQRGFVIGYHQNALARAGANLDAAVELYRQDVNELRKLYNIDFVVPHGGLGWEIDGTMHHNVDVPMPDEFEGNLRWVFNRYGPKFQNRWSDGGLRKSRDLKRLSGLDLVQNFLHRLQPGTRNFCLIHPQRWGYNVDPNQNPMLAEQPWYQRVCRSYAPSGLTPSKP